MDQSEIIPNPSVSWTREKPRQLMDFHEIHYINACLSQEQSIWCSSYVNSVVGVQHTLLCSIYSVNIRPNYHLIQNPWQNIWKTEDVLFSLRLWSCWNSPQQHKGDKSVIGCVQIQMTHVSDTSSSCLKTIIQGWSAQSDPLHCGVRTLREHVALFIFQNLVEKHTYKYFLLCVNAPFIGTVW